MSSIGFVVILRSWLHPTPGNLKMVKCAEQTWQLVGTCSSYLSCHWLAILWISFWLNLFTHLRFSCRDQCGIWNEDCRSWIEDWQSNNWVPPSRQSSVPTRAPLGSELGWLVALVKHRSQQCNRLTLELSRVAVMAEHGSWQCVAGSWNGPLAKVAKQGHLAGGCQSGRFLSPDKQPLTTGSQANPEPVAVVFYYI